MYIKPRKEQPEVIQFVHTSSKCIIDIEIVMHHITVKKLNKKRIFSIWMFFCWSHKKRIYNKFVSFIVGARNPSVLLQEFSSIQILLRAQIDVLINRTNSETCILKWQSTFHVSLFFFFS